MKSIILACSICLLGGSYGSDDTDGVGAYVYQDSAGQRTFDNIDHQKLAYGAARKAYDLTSNQAGYNPNFASSRFPFGGDFPGFGGFPGPQGYPGFQGFPDFQMPNFDRSGNSAYASSAVGPDFTHQAAEIYPANENNPNINKFSSVANAPTGQYSSVSSSSYASTNNKNGQLSTSRGAETVVNRNGVITKYKVES